jgi:hypothetical protein
LRSSNHNRKRKVGGTYDNNNAPSKLLCMAGDELKNDLATILNVRSENLVETLTILLCNLNGGGNIISSSGNSSVSSNGSGSISSRGGNSSITTATTTGSIH